MVSVVLPRSLNTAWLSVASSVAALVIPAAYGVDGSVEWVAMCLAAIFTALGAARDHLGLPAALIHTTRVFARQIDHLMASSHAAGAGRCRCEMALSLSIVLQQAGKASG